MAMGPMPGASPEQAQEAPQGSEQPTPGGASQLVAAVHDGLMKLQDMIGAKFPEDGQQLAQITQAFQSFVEGLGQAPGASKPAQGPATSSPEAGAADVQPAM